MEDNKKSNIIIIGLIVVIILIIAQNIKFKNEIEKIEDEFTYKLENYNREISNISNDIPKKIESILKQQQSVITDYNTSCNGVDTEKETVKSIFKFTLKETEANSNVYLNVSTQNDTTGKDYECISTNSLNYSCEVELSYKENYIINIYQKSLEGNYKKLNSYSYQYNLMNDFKNRVSLMESGVSTDEERARYTCKIRNKTFGEQSLGIKQVVLNVFYNDKEVLKKDLTSYNIVNLDERNEAMLMVAAGNGDQSDIQQIEYGQITMDEKGDEIGNYIVEILHSETGAPVEVNNYPEYSYKLIITFNNGDIQEF